MSALKTKCLFNPVLTQEAANKLKRRLFGKDKSVKVNSNHQGIKKRNQLVVKNIRLVYKIASRFNRRIFNIPALDFDDLVQEGSIGLITAAEKFDFSRGFKFSTYATWWIKQKIIRAIQCQSRLIRIPIYAQELSYKIMGIRETFLLIHKRYPTIEEIAKVLSLPVSRIRKFARSASFIVSFSEDLADSKGGGGEEGVSREEGIEDNRGLKPECLADGKEELENERNKIRELQAALFAVPISHRNRLVFNARYGLNNGALEIRTLDNIGKRFDISRERARQIIRSTWVNLNSYGNKLTHNRLIELLEKVHQLENLVGEAF